MANAKKVCIVGDSWIVGLRRYCQHLGIESNFGCPGVELIWHGQDDMKWESVIQNLMEKSEARGSDVLIIHCGGNDLGCMRGVSLMCQMKDDFSRILQMLPNCKLVFSTIAERRVWKLGAVSGGKLERTRRRVNKEVAAFLRDHQMDSIKHRNINFADSTLYYEDGVCLSRKGNDHFLRNIKEYLNL